VRKKEKRVFLSLLYGLNGWSGPKGNIGRKKYSIKERKTGETRRSTS
jgi:hypothetical protein